VAFHHSSTPDLHAAQHERLRDMGFVLDPLPCPSPASCGGQDLDRALLWAR
jgi:hypothetical protein